jgi:hypothetical protein
MRHTLRRRNSDRYVHTSYLPTPRAPHPPLRVLPVALLMGVLLLCSAAVAQAQPANDDIAQATVITTLDFTDALDTSSATPDGPGGCAELVSNNVWYTITLSEDTVVQLTTNGSDYFAFIDVFVRTAQGNYNLVTCSDNLIFVASAGTTYYVAVSSPDSSGGNLVFSALDLGPTLQITLSLDNTAVVNKGTGTVTVGGTVTCNNPAGVDVGGQLRQKLGRRIIAGGFSTHVSCDGETAWSATARSDQGAFGSGSVELLVDAYSCEQFTCDDDHATTTMRLSGKK